MRKSLILADLLGIVICSLAVYMSAYLALCTLRDDPAGQKNFLLGLALNLMAAAVFASGVLSKFSFVKRSNSAFADKLCASLPKLFAFGFMLLSVYVVGDGLRGFRTIMALVSFPCGLGAIACASGIFFEARNHYRRTHPGRHQSKTSSP